MHIREKLARRATEGRLSLPAASFRGLEAYFELLRKWNQRVSLTSLRVEEYADEAIDRLLIEPALAAQHLPNSQATVIDVGSGGGSPALPIKLVSPGIAMVMVESKLRKATFLRECVRQLDLTRTTVEPVRFEELLAKPGFRDAADVVTLRAVKVDLATLSAVQAFLKPGGRLFLFTSTSQMDITPPPQLAQEATHPLLPQMGSQLRVLRRLP